MKLARISISLIAIILVSQYASALRVKESQVILDELQDYEMCQTKDYTGEWCYDALKRWVKEHPADAFKAGKLTRKTMNHWAAIPFFHQAFEAKKGDCKDEDVQLAVVSGLDLPKDSNETVIAQARKIGIDTCLKEVQDKLVKEASLDSYLFKNTCKDLIKKNLLTGLKKKKCEEMK